MNEYLKAKKEFEHQKALRKIRFKMEFRKTVKGYLKKSVPVLLGASAGFFTAGMCLIGTNPTLAGWFVLFAIISIFCFVAWRGL
jgi:hypothetical protein